MFIGYQVSNKSTMASRSPADGVVSEGALEQTSLSVSAKFPDASATGFLPANLEPQEQ
jgi:hypothetical protein